MSAPLTDSAPPVRGAIVYLPPLADERAAFQIMAGRQTAAFAAMGYAVRHCRLAGCSAADTPAEARWDHWQEEVAATAGSLLQDTDRPLHLWGAGLGGLLALACAARLRPASLILWQPYLHGRAAINALLRRHLTLQAAPPPSTLQLRERLAADGRLALGNCVLPAALAAAVDACDAVALPLPPCRVYWLAHGGPAASHARASAARLMARWRSLGVRSVRYALPSPAMRTGQAAYQCAALLPATCALFSRHPH